MLKSTSSESVNEHNQWGNPGIVIVDDNNQNLKILYEILDGKGYKLLLANNGLKAVDLVKNIQPDLVLLDILLPDISGFDVCRRLKADELTRQIPIIFLSALTDLDSKIKGFEVGGGDYIAKPFQSAEVLARVRTHLRIRMMDRELKQKNIQLQADQTQILDAMGEGIYGLDLEGNIIFANSAAAKMNLCHIDNLIGLNFFQIHLRNQQGSKKDVHFERVVERHFDNDQLPQFFHIVKFFRPDGSQFLADLNVTTKYDGEKPVGSVVVFSDITEPLKLSEQLDDARKKIDIQRDQIAHVTRLSTMGEMAAGLAHELNQPLTAITNYAGLVHRLLAKQPIDTHLAQEALSKMQAQSLRASEVIQHLRSFVSRPKGGKKKISLEELVKDAINFSEIDITLHHGKLIAEYDPELPEVEVDDIQIQQVLINLIRNALEATSLQGHSLPINVIVKCGDGFAEIQVLDQGVGVPESHLKRLFYPFNTTKKDGMGVGLSLCQSIIQAHGGRIYYHPNTPSGSVFGFKIPIVV